MTARGGRTRRGGFRRVHGEGTQTAASCGDYPPTEPTEVPLTHSPKQNGVLGFCFGVAMLTCDRAKQGEKISEKLGRKIRDNSMC